VAEEERGITERGGCGGEHGRGHPCHEHGLEARATKYDPAHPAWAERGNQRGVVVFFAG